MATETDIPLSAPGARVSRARQLLENAEHRVQEASIEVADALVLVEGFGEADETAKTIRQSHRVLCNQVDVLHVMHRWVDPSGDCHD